MDIALFFIGLLFLLKHDYGITMGIVVLLASSYLGVALEGGGVAEFPVVHNVQDTGIFLYILLLLAVSFRDRGTFYKDVMAKPVLGLFCFLFLTSCIDISVNEYPVGDVIRNIRNWSFLSIIFIHKNFTQQSLRRMLSFILYATLFLCLVLLLQRVSGIHIIGDTRAYYLAGQMVDRGVKPPFYVILCLYLLYAQYYQFSSWKKWLYIVVLFSPVVLSLKISYLTAIFLGIFSIEMFNRRSLVSFIPTAVGGVFLAGALIVILFTVNPVLHHRFLDTVGQVESVQKKESEGNFAYRLLHFSERFEYCLNSGPQLALFGIGSVSESNFQGTPFNFGQIENDRLEKAQINTGDIAWSLLILRFGLIGIIFFLILYFKLLRKLFHCKQNPLVLVVMVYMLVNIFALSLSTTNICYSEFFIIPLLVNSVMGKSWA